MAVIIKGNRISSGKENIIMKDMKQINETGAEILALASKLTDLGDRYPGNPAEREAAQVLIDNLKAVGVKDVTYETYPIKCYRHGEQSVSFRVNGAVETLQAYPIWYTHGGKVTAEILPIGLGLGNDWKKHAAGRIVFAQSILAMNFLPSHNMLDLYLEAEKAGAVGFIAYTNSPCGIVSRYDELIEHDPDGSIPGVLVEQADGRMIQAVCEGSNSMPEITISSDAEIYQGEAGDIYGVIPGTEDILILETHYDSVYAGAVDNAGGNAVWVKLAGEIAAMKEPHPTVILAGNTAHENVVGARHYIKRHKDITERAYAIFNVDGAGSTGYIWNDNSVMPTGKDETRVIHTSKNPLLTKICMKAVRDYDLFPTFVAPMSRIVCNVDLEETFANEGIPMLLCIGKPVWYHSNQDTVDKMTSEQLGRSYYAHLQMLQDIFNTDPEEIAAVNDLPYEDYLKAISSFPEATEAEKNCPAGMLFNVVPQTPKAQETVLVSISTPYGPDSIILDIEWDMGDGIVLSGPISSHKYAEPGHYTIRLSWLNDKGIRSHIDKNIWVL